MLIIIYNKLIFNVFILINIVNYFVYIFITNKNKFFNKKISNISTDNTNHHFF